MGKRLGWLSSAALSAGFVVLGLALAPAAHASCTAPANDIVAENCQPGDAPPDITGDGDPGIQGFATQFSVAQGDPVGFKVRSDRSAYSIDIYRLGWYRGVGSRKVASLPVTGSEPQDGCVESGSTGLIDCSNWAVAATWAMPNSATSGIYIAVLDGVSHVPFVVRDDDGASDLLFQTSDTTWQAYNNFGGNSLYDGSPVGRAYKVSYNRPFRTRENSSEDFLFNAEYPMVRWLERNGYDVSYFSGADSDRYGAELREHRTFLSVGHDEYWSGTQRANVEAARDAGVNLAFFSGNEVFWKTRWEDGHRTLVTYKETQPNSMSDPSGTWTGTWRDPRSPGGARPENALTGTSFEVNAGTSAIQVPAGAGKLRLWRGTSVASLAAAGATATLADDTLGYEWDEDLDNGFRPAGLVRLSSTFDPDVETLQDAGWIYGRGSATHHLTLHRDSNGAGPDALVFGAGTIQWSWGLDDQHDRGVGAASPAMQQATTNLFADMAVQPGSPDGVQPATPSTDTVAPSAAIASPATIAVVTGRDETIRGSAVDSGGGRVGAVEVSIDGGASWHPADGRESWTYTWKSTRSGNVTPLVRAADDSGNIGPPDASTPAVGGGIPLGGGIPTGAGIGPSGGHLATSVALSPRRARMSRKGIVKLRMTCPAGGPDCRAQLRLRLQGRTIAGQTLIVASGKTRSVALKLKRGPRQKLRRIRVMRVTALANLDDRAQTRVSIRLLAPKR